MIKIQVFGFDWDDGNREKCQKHGLSLTEIESFFSGEGLYVAPDIQHSRSEGRFIAIGQSTAGRGMFAAFAFRAVNGELFIRPISARTMHEREAKKYEEARAQSED